MSRLMSLLAGCSVGCLLALGGLLLFFTGALGTLWPLILIGAGLYLFWGRAMPAAKTIDRRGGFSADHRRSGVDAGDRRGGMEADDFRKAMDHQIQAASGRVPPDVLAKVQSIRQIILGIVPRLAALPEGSPERFIVDRTATEYLPTALESYLNLPTAYATLHPVKDGKTPKQVLMDQLTLLESTMNKVAATVLRNDTDRLLANARFLEERFGRSDLSLPGPASGT